MLLCGRETAPGTFRSYSPDGKNAPRYLLAVTLSMPLPSKQMCDHRGASQPCKHRALPGKHARVHIDFFFFVISR